ncbi:MAG: hypothetical protein ACP5RQ_02200 [Candidatus Micrarchaeia archaeon]
MNSINQNNSQNPNSKIKGVLEKSQDLIKSRIIESLSSNNANLVFNYKKEGNYEKLDVLLKNEAMIKTFPIVEIACINQNENNKKSKIIVKIDSNFCKYDIHYPDLSHMEFEIKEDPRYPLYKNLKDFFLKLGSSDLEFKVVFNPQLRE